MVRGGVNNSDYTRPKCVGITHSVLPRAKIRFRLNDVEKLTRGTPSNQDNLTFGSNQEERPGA